MKMTVHNHETVKNQIREYYTEADLWWKAEQKKCKWAFLKLDCIDDNGETYFKHVVDNVTSKKKLRQILVEEAPLNAYWSVSRWMNPSITREKTYKDKNGGRLHIDKNHFLFSDMVIDFDHKDTEEVERVWDYLVQEKGIKEENMYLVYSGGGWHINIDEWYRNPDIPHPIKREKDAFKQFQAFTDELVEQGFDFDYMPQQTDNGLVYNSPSGDTRRVRKIPGTVTKYGNKSEVVNKKHLHNYTEEKIMEIETSQPKKDIKLDDEIAEVKQIGK